MDKIINENGCYCAYTALVQIPVILETKEMPSLPSINLVSKLNNNDGIKCVEIINNKYRLYKDQSY